eukprot:4288532-Pleurochrysis_carterae.AAC.1
MMSLPLRGPPAPQGGSRSRLAGWLASLCNPRAHVALGWALPRLVLAAVGVVHVEFEHKADLDAVEYAASKVAAMGALVAHKVGGQRSAVGNLSVDAMKPTSLVPFCMSRNGTP